MTVSHLAVVLLPLFALPGAGRTDPPTSEPAALPPAITKPLPESLDDLRAIQEQTKKVLARVVPCTVGVVVGNAAGSGVIVSKDGLVLTAGHVSGKPGKKCTLILPDATRLEGKSLGCHPILDSGMFQITTPGEWPFVELGNSGKLKPGQWCIAVGQPAGFKVGRTPVVRVGRVLYAGKTVLNTDCTVVGGDSGGPLFDMEGRVIGIHSRIGETVTSNKHVPIDHFRDNWDRLLKGEEIGIPPPPAYFGVGRDEAAPDCKLGRVSGGSPAEKAGLKAGDVITRFDGKDVKTYDDLLALLAKKKPTDEVEVLVKREKESRTLKVKLDKRD